MKRLVASALTLALLCIFSSGSKGQALPEQHPFISPLFGDNMVLQRERPLPIWGWTTPGQKVTVKIQGQTASAIADSDGQWMAKLKPLKAGGPYKLMVEGPQTVTASNVLVGDVWICSGQSNMEFGIGNANNAAQEIANAKYPQIRLFAVQKSFSLTPRTGLTTDSRQLLGQWSECSPETVRTGGWNGFSAVAYFFGRHLYQQLQVPIGLIHTSWGGTPAEAWTSAEALDALSDFKPAVAQLAQMRSDLERGVSDYAQRVSEWYAKNDPGSAVGAGWETAAYDAANWKTMNLPTYWKNAGVPELSAYDGVVWFRKEIDLPESAAGKAAVLHLGPIDDRDTTWVNGTRVGGMELYNQVRNYQIPADVLKPGKNVLVVRVLDTGGKGGIYGSADQMHLDVEGQTPVSLVGAWNYNPSMPLNKATPFPLTRRANQNSPTTLYNGMIAPLIPYAFKGVIWYQGETNVGRAYQYRTLLPAMIEDWRSRWHEGPFPFYIVQLANFTAQRAQPGEDAWAELREAQSLTAQRLPNAGIAVIIDIGEGADIHPKDKQDVGDRLALVALGKAYGKKGFEYSGPEYTKSTVEGNTVRLTFDHLGGGLVAKGGDKLEGFAIAGPEDPHKFVWADARIEGNTVVVSSPLVPHPAAVRYAWAANPVCNLYNKAGLPASPFRTDRWPSITVDNK